MNKTLIIIGIVIVAVILFIKFGLVSSQTDLNNKKRPNNKPTKLIDNDKIILVRNLKLEYLKKAIEQFCNASNQNSFLVLPRVTILENQFLITFPYDVDFEQLCYFINYLKYANELCLKPDYKPEIKAWCKTKESYSWMTNEITDKRVMIFIPDWDKEYDNVYLTTQDNLGFKMCFAIGSEHQKLEKPVYHYENLPVTLNNLEEKEKFDFE